MKVHGQNSHKKVLLLQKPGLEACQKQKPFQNYYPRYDCAVRFQNGDGNARFENTNYSGKKSFSFFNLNNKTQNSFDHKINGKEF